MPELPEVETVVRGLRAAGAVGARIRQVDVRWPRTVAGAAPAAFVAALRGRTIRLLARRGKHIVADLDGGRHLLVHLRMTGQFRLEAPGAPPDPHDRLILALQRGRQRWQLHYRDTRKFGRFRLTDSPRTLLARLGPEPLAAAFTAAALRARLAGRRRMLKPLLLDQSTVAGLGNIYVDEALWRARLHPCRQAGTLAPAETARLHAAIRKVLREAVDIGGTSLGDGRANFYSVAGRRGRHADNLRVFRRTGAPCPRCGRPVVRIVVGQRGTHLCPRCQPPPE